MAMCAWRETSAMTTMDKGIDDLSALLTANIDHLSVPRVPVPMICQQIPIICQRQNAGSADVTGRNRKNEVPYDNRFDK
jgi:hypothetical protein